MGPEGGAFLSDKYLSFLESEYRLFLLLLNTNSTIKKGKTNEKNFFTVAESSTHAKVYLCLSTSIDFK